MNYYCHLQPLDESDEPVVSANVVSRLLAVRLFSENASSSYLIQRYFKPRRYYYNKVLIPDLRPRFSRLSALPLACLGFACSNFAKKNKRLLAV